MMSELFDEEYLQRQFMISEREKNRAEGRAEGISSMVGILKSLNIPSAEIIEKLTAAYDLTPEAAQEYLTAAH